MFCADMINIFIFDDIINYSYIYLFILILYHNIVILSPKSLAKFIHNNALYTKGIEGQISSSLKGSRLFLGIGGGRRLLTRGVPFDVIVMIMAAEELKQRFKIKKAVILIADEITKINAFSLRQIDQVSNYEYMFFTKLIAFLGFENWSVIRQSDYISDNEYIEKFRYYVEEIENNPEIVIESINSSYLNGRKNLKEADQLYELFIKKFRKSYSNEHHILHFALELADIDYLLKNGGFKIGWKMPGPKEMDEQTPNQVYLKCNPGKKDKVFLYTRPGIRVNPIYFTNRIENTVPYICYFPGSRILFHPDENISKKLKLVEKNVQIRNYINNYYNQAIRHYVKLTGRKIKGTVEERLQLIINDFFAKNKNLRNLTPNFFESGVPNK